MKFFDSVLDLKVELRYPVWFGLVVLVYILLKFFLCGLGLNRILNPMVKLWSCLWMIFETVHQNGTREPRR